MKKGISLIVLVITIIVMIIIAGAIIISLSNSNVIDKAEDAVSQTNQKSALTLAALGKSEFIMNPANNYSTGLPETSEAVLAEATITAANSETDPVGVIGAINNKLTSGGAEGFYVKYIYDSTGKKNEIVLFYDQDNDRASGAPDQGSANYYTADAADVKVGAI